MMAAARFKLPGILREFMHALEQGGPFELLR